MTSRVLVERNGPVATVTLNRPHKHNAVNADMFAALSAAGRELACDRRVRAVVLKGAGDSFCAGIDTDALRDASIGAALGENLAPQPDSPANFFQHAAWVWRELPVPVIAALKGVAFGAGLQIALAADVRLAAPDTRCAVMEIRWGIVPDMALTRSARHVVRLDHLRELVYSGRIVAANEACDLGLVTRLEEAPEAAAYRLAEAIARRSPDAVRAAKALLNLGVEEAGQRALRREAELQLALLGTPNQREAVAAMLGKREPRFSEPGDPGDRVAASRAPDDA